MRLKSECMYFSQCGGCISHPRHSLFTLSLKLVMLFNGYDCAICTSATSLTSPSQRHLFVSNCVSVGAGHGDSTAQHPWSQLVIHASRVSRHWLCRRRKQAFCPTCFSHLLFQNALEIRRLQLIFCTKCECWATRWTLAACGLRNSLFLSMEVFWFYFSAEQSLLWENCSVCWSVLIFGERKIGWSGLLPLCRLKWDLSFPVSSD